MDVISKSIGCIVMASGLSARYGKNKLLETLGGRAVILHTADSLRSAGFAPVVVARSEAIATLLAGEGFRCILHDGPKKSDTMRVGLKSLNPDALGVLFMPGDQPLTLPASLRRLAERFLHDPTLAVRLGFGDTPGSPVVFPAAYRDDLMTYAGDRGGLEVLRHKNAPCDVVQADFDWELWDVDTPESMARVREVYNNLRQA